MDGWETRRRRDVGPTPRLVHRPARRARDRARRRRRHRVLHRQLSRSRARSTPAIVPGMPARRRAGAGAVARAAAADAARPAMRTTCSPIDGAPAATHLRLRIFPDGGVARLRVHGEVVADWDRLRRRGDVDLAAVEHGGIVVACSDMFFGSRHNLIMPGDATHMGDGWETKRRRGPGPRLDDRPARRRGHDSPRRGRHAPLQGQRAGRLQPRRRAGRWTTVEPLGSGRRGASCCRARRCSRMRGTPSRTSCARSATSRTCGSIFFPTAASAACGCSGGRDEPTAETRDRRAKSSRARDLGGSAVDRHATRGAERARRGAAAARCCAAADRRAGRSEMAAARPFADAEAMVATRRCDLAGARSGRTGSRRSRRTRGSGRTGGQERAGGAGRAGRGRRRDGRSWSDEEQARRGRRRRR